MPVPDQIMLYRLVHVDVLPTLLTRGALHAPNYTPNDGMAYRTIHSVSVQASRHDRPILCGPGGTCHDFVPFYFGPLSVMLLNLKTGRVPGYTEGQAPLIYLTTTVARVYGPGARARFIFNRGPRVPVYYPFVWRGWTEFGSGAVGDIAPHERGLHGA